MDDLSLDGSCAGPAGTVMVVGLNGSNACHDPDATCNQLRSLPPHVFHVVWCADTRGFRGISCDLDLGYRSAQGARHGLLEYSLDGLAAGLPGARWTNASTAVFPDAPFPFDSFAVASGKNNILTVYQLSMAEGNVDGDDLALTATSGFCCRAKFSGGKTDTGTLYVGDLKIRANAVVAAPAPGGGGGAAAAPAAYTGAAVGGAVVGGGVAGAACALALALAAQWRATGRPPAWLPLGAGYSSLRVPPVVQPGPDMSLLAAARAAQLARPVVR